MPSALKSALCLLALQLSPLEAHAQGHPPGAPSRTAHVLLIGVDDYEQVPGFKSLDGPGNDIALMARTLTARLGIPASRMTILRNEHATHARLRKAFEALAARVAPGDWVYIHFSGHGSIAVDPTDPTGFDQTWVPFGARSGKSLGLDDHDIRDKAISAWLKPIHAKTDQLVFVSDSCHSASVTRGTAKGRIRGLRSAPPDTRLQPEQPFALELPGEAPGIRIGAAEDTDSASEFDPDRGVLGCTSSKRCYGVFSWFWARALAEASAGETWFDVFQKASTLARGAGGTLSRPQFSGSRRLAIYAPLDRPVEVTFTASLPVTSVDPMHRLVTLGAGLLEGLTTGSRYVHTGDAARAPEGEIVLTSVGAFSAQAEVLAGAFTMGQTVRESQHAHPGEPWPDKRLADAARARVFENLTSSSNGIPLRVSVVQLTPAGSCEPTCLYLPGDKAHRHAYRIATEHPLPQRSIRVAPGDALAFRVQEQDDAYTSTDWHLYLAHMSPDPGEITLIFPAPQANDGEARLRTDGPPRTDLFAFNAKVFTDVGRHVVTVLFTSEPLSLGLIETAGHPVLPAARVAAPAQADMATALTPPPAPASQTGEAKDGKATKALEEDALWHSAQFEVLVSPAHEPSPRPQDHSTCFTPIQTAKGLSCDQSRN